MQTTPTTIYNILFDHFGPQHWWPIDNAYHQKHNTDPRFEIIIGAILTQNTAWKNVEKAIINLKNNKMLSIKKINQTPIETLRDLIKPSGFFNQKAYRLQIMSDFLTKKYHENLNSLFYSPYKDLRKELLTLNGIGPETADSILLYAGKKPLFVVDSYTKRLCARLPFPVDSTSYDEIQLFFQRDIRKNFKSDQIIQIYNEFHAVIVEWAKQYCYKKKPQCINCPLNSQCYSKKKL